MGIKSVAESCVKKRIEIELQGVSVTLIDPIQRTESFVRDFFSGDSGGHDWWHTYRVCQLAKKIWEKEGGDLLVVELAALLHDVGDYKFSAENEAIGIDRISEWLKEIEVEERINSEVITIVTSINFRGSKDKKDCKSIECKIVQDADFLDAIGAIGIGRAFAYGGFKGHIIYDPAIKPVKYVSFEDYKKRESSTINHFYEKLLLLQEMINTDTGKIIADGRHKYMKHFLEQFHAEWNLRDYDRKFQE